MSTIFINGKFTAQRTTGVQRMAGEIVQHLDALLASQPAIAAGTRWQLLCPPDTTVLPTLRHIETRYVGRAGAAGGLHRWEQFTLPLAARHGLLINLAGSAPLLTRQQVCTMNDAAVFDHPEAYTPAFARWYRFLFGQLARRARLILTISEFSRTRLVARLPAARQRMAVLRLGSDHTRPAQADASILTRHGLAGRRYLLAVGSANPTKNLPALTDAFGRLADTDVLLVLAGGSNKAVFAGAQGSGESARVVRVGAVNDAELTALYSAALGFVFPSTYEGFGLPPLEAMRCGCPVTAARAASIPEVCGDAALYFDPLDTADIARALDRLVGDAGLQQRLRQAGADRSAQFRWQDTAAELLAHLAERQLVGVPPS